MLRSDSSALEGTCQLGLAAFAVFPRFFAALFGGERIIVSSGSNMRPSFLRAKLKFSDWKVRLPVHDGHMRLVRFKKAILGLSATGNGKRPRPFSVSTCS